MRDRWFFGFFVVSGFCSLLCQVVWLRLTMARFGVTTAMVSVVVSVFMAGLALGSAGGGRLAARTRSPRSALVLYAACELAIALSARVVPSALAAGRALFAGSAWASGAYHLMSGLWVALVLLPFCIAMGATLPLALAAVGARVRGGRSAFGHLYAANVVGAAVGTLAAALVLVEMLGLQGTLELGAAFNALLAVTALALALSPAGTAPGPAAEGALTTPAPALAALFGTGFASMAMEVVWVRQFAPLLGNLVYAFAIILASYLLATLAGSLLYRARSRALPEGGPRPGLWILVALVALLPTLAADPRLPYAPRLGSMPLPSLAGILLVALAVAPFSGLLGFITPWLVDRWSGGAAPRAGTAYAVNAAGCVVGPLAAGFFLLPWIGERWALFALALIPIAIGAAAARASFPRLAAAVAGAAVVAALARGEEARFPEPAVRRDSTATVIAAGSGFGQILMVNGVNMTVLTPITKFMAHMPLAFLPAPPRRGLVICFGMGTSFRSMHSWGIETTAVELVPSVPRFFTRFHPDAADLLRAPDAHIVVDDGRRFLDRTLETYDVVVVDPPPPVEAAGSSLLYSREFYRSVRARLAPAGILQTWIPGADPMVTAAFLGALHDVFPYVRVFRSVEGWGVHLLASGREIPVRSAEELAGRLPPAAAADLVAWGPHPTAREQLRAVLESEITPNWTLLSSMAPSLTDDRPLNEYFLVRRLHGRVPAR